MPHYQIGQADLGKETMLTQLSHGTFSIQCAIRLLPSSCVFPISSPCLRDMLLSIGRDGTRESLENIRLRGQRDTGK